MEARVKLLVVGLGSMGKRRVRNLLALGVDQVAGFDLRDDRRAEAREKYGIDVYDGFEIALERVKPDALVISTSPEHHMTYAFPAAERGLSCFIEASVVDAEKIRDLAERTRGGEVVMAPSCTMRFFPGPRKVKELVRAGVVGRVLTLTYQTGQYLTDWHPWEDISEFYVSRRETGGCREIVPFELTWLNDIFGKAEPLACVKAKLTDMNADIDDVYHCLLRYPDGVLCNLCVEVISRPNATREMRILGSEGQIVYSADENCVRYATPASPQWVRFELGGGTVESGYINPEEPYIEEMRAFVSAVAARDGSLYPNTLADDYDILRTLERLDAMSPGAR